MREIKLTVRGDTVQASQYLAGVRGSANATTLVITFDESWDGYAKKIVFWDALDQNEVTRILTADLLVDRKNDIRTYQTTIPGEALAVAGECLLVIEGWKDGSRLRAIPLRLVVEDAPSSAAPADPTPTQAEQLQVQIDTLLDDMVACENRAAVSENNAAKSADDAERAKDDAQEAQRAAEDARDEAQQIFSDNLARVVNKTGDTMTGPLIIKAKAPSFYLNSTTRGRDSLLTYSQSYDRVYLQNRKNSKNYNGICVSSEEATLDTALRLLRTVGGKTNWYNLIHTGNLFNRAVNKAGDTMTGQLNVVRTGTSEYILTGKNEDIGRSLYLAVSQTGPVVLANQVPGDIKNRNRILINPETSDLSSLLQIRKTIENKSSTYNVLHTGNLEALGVARIEVGSYEGTGTYGSSKANSLTFGFTPKIWGIFTILSGGSYYSYAPYFFRWNGNSDYVIDRQKDGTTTVNIYVKYKNNTVSWYNGTNANYQRNKAENTYYYFAIG